MGELADRLAHPSRVLDLDGLAASWSWVRLAARVRGHGHLVHDMTLLRRLRGGLGRVLMRGASEDALAGRPCPWEPACALDVFFREQGRTGAHGIPKPFVLWTDRRGDDLSVGMSLFGMAMDWAPVMALALPEVLRDGIDWAGLSQGRFTPLPAIDGVLVAEGGALPMVEDRLGGVSLRFLTPMNAEGDDPLDRPSTVLARLARRIEGMARWQEAALDVDWPALGRLWLTLDYDTTSLVARRMQRRSGQAGRRFGVDTVEGTLRVANAPASLAPLLRIGTVIHVGKGAAEGYGRFRADAA